MLENFPEPSTLRFTTGGDEEAEITRQRDVFFQDIREELGLGTTRCDVFFTAESRGLYRPIGAENDTQPTDDCIHLLDFAGIQTVASVLDRRDDMNFHVVTFSAHLLSLHAMDRVLALRRELTAFE